MDGHQRRRAGGVHRHARPAEVQRVGDPVGGDAHHAAGGRVDVDGAQFVDRRLEHRVVVGRDADEHAGCRRLAVEQHAAVLDRLPGGLQQQPLLGVHEFGLARRDAEEIGVKQVDAVDEAAPPRDRLAGDARPGIVESADVPPVARHVRDAVDPVEDHLPEFGRSIRSTGIAASDPDDGNIALSHRAAPCPPINAPLKAGGLARPIGLFSALVERLARARREANVAGATLSKICRPSTCAVGTTYPGRIRRSRPPGSVLARRSGQSEVAVEMVVVIGDADQVDRVVRARHRRHAAVVGVGGRRIVVVQQGQQVPMGAANPGPRPNPGCGPALASGPPTCRGRGYCRWMRSPTPHSAGTGWCGR